MSAYNKERDIIRRFHSPSEFLAFVKAQPENKRCYADAMGDRSWAGGASGESCVQRLEFGDTQYLKRAEQLMEQMRAQGLYTNNARIWDTEIVGSFPCVPSYLAGLPETMFAQVETESPATTTPIRLYVDIVTSSGVSSKEIIDRGIAILGLVLALQLVRPVELYCFSLGKGGGCKGATSGTITQIDTAPLDFDRATFMLCDPGFMRQICYGAMFNVLDKPFNGHIGWAWGHSSIDAEYEATLREALECNPDDMVLTGTFLTQYEYRDNPVKWIKDQLIKLGAQFNE